MIELHRTCNSVNFDHDLVTSSVTTECVARTQTLPQRGREGLANIPPIIGHRRAHAAVEGWGGEAYTKFMMCDTPTKIRVEPERPLDEGRVDCWPNRWA